MVKRICIISPSAYPLLVGDKNITTAGGAEAQLSMIGKSFADRGLEVHYIVDDFGQVQCEKFDKVYIHKSPLRYMGGSNWYLIPDWLIFLKRLWDINADYHLIKLPRNLLLPLGLYTWLRKRKLIFIGQIDTDVDLEFLKQYEGRITYWLYRLGIKFVDYIIAQNEIQREGFERLFNKKTQIIRSVITLPEVLNVDKEDYVLWVGSSLQKKQPQKFLDLARQLPKIKFRMIVAPANQEVDNQLRIQAKDILNLEYLGFVPLSEIGSYFSKAILFVSTSLREGFPNTFLQSWQYGVPVISLQVDPDGVINRYNLGMLSETIEQMCLDIEEVMTDSVLRNKLSDNSKKYVEDYHSRNTIVEQFINVLEGL